MFTLDHILWLVISAAMVTLLTVFSVKKKWSFKKVAIIVAIIALASEIFKIATHMYPVSRNDFFGNDANFATIVKDDFDGNANASYLLPKSLPFHLCSILIFFIFFLALSNNQKLIEKVKTFCVPVFLLAGVLALIINTCFGSDINAFESFTGEIAKLNAYKASGDALDLAKYVSTLSAWQYFPFHAAIVWFGLYLMITKQVKFGFKEWLRNDVILLALLVFAIWVNSFTLKYKTNFMFVVYPPAKGLPLLNLKHGWHVYMIHYMFVGALLTFLFQLYWMIKEWTGKKSSTVKTSKKSKRA